MGDNWIPMVLLCMLTAYITYNTTLSSVYNNCTSVGQFVLPKKDGFGITRSFDGETLICRIMNDDE